MIPVVVCDDNEQDLAVTSEAVRRVLPEAAIRSFADPKALLDSLPGNVLPKLAVLDIQMDDLDGIHLAEQLCRLCPGCRIIFITDYLEYATEVYSVRHSYFVLKPQLQERIGAAVQQALEDLFHLTQLSFTHNGLLRLVDIESVIYMERSLRKTKIFCDSDCYESYEHCQKIVQRSEADCFCQCHKSFWVNMNRVCVMGKDHFVMDNGATVPISRSFQKTVKTQFLVALHRELETAAHG